MITTIIFLSLAFTWLVYETDWMRARLLMGKFSPYMADDTVTVQMKRELLGSWFGGKVDKVLRCHLESPDAQPLFGWGFAYQYKDFNPECKVELIGEGYKTTMRSTRPDILRDALRINRNPYIKVKLT